MILKFLGIVSFIVASLFGLNAHAQAFPNRPVEIVLGFPAGGSADVAMRVLSESASQKLGEKLIVVNRDGGGGVVAAAAAKLASPDGYTLLVAHIGTHAILESLQDLPFDPRNDFVPVVGLLSWPHYLVAPANSPLNSAADLKAWAARKPGGLSYGSQGIGSGGHLLGALLNKQIGAMVHVPYKGGGPLLIDMLAERVDLSFTGSEDAIQQVRAGKLKMLAVGSDRRSPLFPDMPTMVESGYPGISQDVWWGLVAPKGTPPAVIAKLEQAFVEAAADEQIKAKMAARNVLVRATSASEFGAYMAAEAAKWRAVISEVGIRKQ